ncbi:GIY-YIG nuclease family protein [Vibrio parahaemolyticus]|uniref:GIY-YIG nuclease family protein n=1 Tax=Vibrio parahaemolyticus TaxID=670 RepID=UPI0003479E5B|nr:GIY-YIG nuclease family protein [Vibrio parahaemolyticus]MDF5409121.1 GIY-YIG nuclease family protein [Vibrio parahaemolyticus]MDG2824618.1 GIY-YIG nuclease family protein [Vibrio parahaemolyticus]MDG2860318.1 GIY-YIG nuclease family protein [Vibrio parahaemolyticus]RXQ00907.1 GIY-YIG nuclease family protein [Vibrio parahaemolyticus]HCG8575818.1 GIY-YIG nuclease family protein [Vibrio parahaemolyticus]
MALYFIIENEDLINQRIKIGISTDPIKRLKNLQTGNSRRLALMGWINSNNDRELERELHQKYQAQRVIGEWFEINHEIVLDLLKQYSYCSYIALQTNAGELIGCDRHGIPEYEDTWEWSSTEYSDFCPECGSSLGLSYNENFGGARCLECGFTV